MRSVAPRTSGSGHAGGPPPARIITQGAFVGSARWIVTPFASATHGANFAPTRPGSVGLENSAETDSFLPDAELGPLLGAIAEDVQQIAAAVRAGIIADFAARAAYARRHLPRHQLGGALRTLAEARRAALTLARQTAAMELKARKKAAIMTRRRLARRAIRPCRKPRDYTPLR
jgi:hypothetical protein